MTLGGGRDEWIRGSKKMLEGEGNGPTTTLEIGTASRLQPNWGGGQRSKKDPAKVLAEASDILDETKDDVGVEAATALDPKCERWGAHRTPMHA